MMGLGSMFLILSILNLFDGIATYIGIHYRIIEEFNPIMASLIDWNPLFFLLVKFSLSLLLILLAKYMKEIRVSKALQGLLTVALGLYSVVAVVHITWLLIVN